MFQNCFHFFKEFHGESEFDLFSEKCRKRHLWWLFLTWKSIQLTHKTRHIGIPTTRQTIKWKPISFQCDIFDFRSSRVCSFNSFCVVSIYSNIFWWNYKRNCIFIGSKLHFILFYKSLNLIWTLNFPNTRKSVCTKKYTFNSLSVRCSLCEWSKPQCTAAIHAVRKQ